MIASQLDIIKEFPPLGKAIQEQFIPLATLVYLSFSILIYTNFEQKLRLYRAVYEAELETMDPSSRMLTMMRYPLAFYGSSFTAPYILMKTHTISDKDFFFGMPLFLLARFAKPIFLLCGAALFAMTGNVFAKVAQVPVQPSWIKYVVLAGCVASSLLSAAMLKAHQEAPCI